MSILTAGSINVFFEEAVRDAMKTQRVEASDPTTSYLVALLADFAKPKQGQDKLDRPLTFLLDEALHTNEVGERFEKLRTLGDGVLYTSGFFGDHFEARGVDTRYIMGIGQTAYGSASNLLRPSSRDLEAIAAHDIFGELAANFAAFVAVIGEVANASIAAAAESSRSVVRLYERWMKTKSDTLADALATHGFVPPRGGTVPS